MLRTIAIIFLSICSVSALCDTKATTNSPITQRRINEIAAACEEAQVSLNGWSVKPKTNETNAQFKIRVQSYIAVFTKLNVAVTPVRTAPTLRYTSTTNIAYWKRITTRASALPTELKNLNGIWTATSSNGGSPKLNSKFVSMLYGLQDLFLSLRNARP